MFLHVLSSGTVIYTIYLCNTQARPCLDESGISWCAMAHSLDLVSLSMSVVVVVISWTGAWSLGLCDVGSRNRPDPLAASAA